MDPNTEYHAIPMSQPEVSFKPEKKSRFGSFSMPHLSGPKALIVSVAIVCATFGTVYYHQHSVSNVQDFGPRLAYGNRFAYHNPGINAGPVHMERPTLSSQFDAVCQALRRKNPYGCVNDPGTYYYDLCKYCLNIR